MSSSYQNVDYSKETISKINESIKTNFAHLVPINSSMKKSLVGVSRMVMLDRYSQKDLVLKTLGKNDVVIVKIKDDPMFPTLGIGLVLELKNNNKVKVKIDEEYWKQIDPFYEAENGVIIVDTKILSKPLEIYFEQIAARVGSYIGKEDQDYINDFIHELETFNFVPAGRILYGAGSNTQTTFFNCYVMPFIADSRDGIANHRKEIMEIMSRGGGVGTNGSTLRPRHSEALTVKGKSSGAVSWLNDLAILTHLIEQGGSRRGAQMIMLNIWHPDIIEFIISKMQNPNILLYISRNFEDETIRAMAKKKLKFTPLKDSERALYEQIIDSSKSLDINAAVLEEAKSKLKAGGVYEVNQPDYLTGANISVAITDDFMEALFKDQEYSLRFPDVSKLSHEQKVFYDKEWHLLGDVDKWVAHNYPIRVYQKIKAKELWKLINFCATYSAEPGVFFIDRANELTNAKTYGQKVVCTNPCGEQPLAPYSVCNLGALNLNNFINHKTKEVEWTKLEKTISIAVRFLDNVITSTPYFLEANQLQAIKERRIGLGIMGFHDMLIWAQIKYGSPEAIKFTDKLFEFIASIAYKTSAKISTEKGSFFFLKDLEMFLKSGYMKKMPDHVKDYIRKCNGIRNSHLLTVAPTGSTGTLVGVSTGLEPYFAFKYFRSGRLGKFMEVEQKIVSEWKSENNWKEEKLPDFFITAMQLTPEEHVDVQVSIQRWVDSSISKTVNAPRGYSVDKVSKIYEELYRKGAKGGTVYVDGSRDSQVLSLEKEETLDESKKIKISQSAEIHIIPPEIVANLDYLQESSEKLANVPANIANRAIGIQVGNICPICKEGVIEKLGGCNSCVLCKSQLKCDV